MKLPTFIEPELATLCDQTPQGPDFIHEIKFDGYRTQARIEKGKVKLLTRRGLDWTDKYFAIAKQLELLPVQNAILDGEIVALDENNRSNFLSLQNALESDLTQNLQYYIFDILFLDNQDLRDLPLVERKAKLKKILTKKKLKNIFYSEHFSYQGEEFLTKLCQENYEGIIAKQAAKPYVSGRNKNWLKIKCHKRQEFVIGGFTLPSDNSAGIGSLVLGYYEDKKLICAGRVGTGFTHDLSTQIRKKLEKLKQEKSPFAKISTMQKRGAIFVKPKLVCEVEFTQWTTDGALRHPSFQGLREDKSAKEIGRDVIYHVRNLQA